MGYVPHIPKSPTRELTFSFDEDKENILPSIMQQNIASVCNIASLIPHLEGECIVEGVVPFAKVGS